MATQLSDAPTFVACPDCGQATDAWCCVCPACRPAALLPVGVVQATRATCNRCRIAHDCGKAYSGEQCYLGVLPYRPEAPVVRTVYPLRTNASQIDPMLPEIDWRNLAGWALAAVCLVAIVALVVMQAR